MQKDLIAIKTISCIYIIYCIFVNYVLKLHVLNLNIIIIIINMKNTEIV